MHLYVEFFKKMNFSCSNVGDYDQTFAVHSKLFVHTVNRQHAIYINSQHKKSDKEQANTLSNIAMYQIKTHLKQASGYFCFNKYDSCIDQIVSSWHMPALQKGSMLNVLPKAMTDKDYVILLFASLFARRGQLLLITGYAESLIVTQFLEGIPDLKKLQRYILRFINYIPKHLVEFLISPSLIEEILSKNSHDSKNQLIDQILVTSSNFRRNTLTVLSFTRSIQSSGRPFYRTTSR